MKNSKNAAAERSKAEISERGSVTRSNSDSNGIVFHEIGKSGWKCRNVPESLKQVALFARAKEAEKIKDINGNEQPRIVHWESSPNSRSHCSGVRQ